MPSPLGRQYSVVARGNAGLSWDDEGLALGCLPLVTSEFGLGGKWRYVVRPAAEVAKALRLAYGSEPDAVIERYHRGLQRVFDLFESGESGRAGVQAVLLGLPKISPEGMAKLAQAEDLLKGGEAWRDEPRVPAGQTGGGDWTSDGGTGSLEAVPEPVKFQGVSPSDRAAFVRSHLADAIEGGKALGVPAENVLGLSALESTWGLGKFAKGKNRNFFSMHYPAPFQSGYVVSDGGTKVSTFASYGDSMRSFIKVYGALVRGKSDPEAFARALQDSGNFGINPDGTKVSTFVHGAANTIRGMRTRIAGQRT
jgi:hypothetical protein